MGGNLGVVRAIVVQHQQRVLADRQEPVHRAFHPLRQLAFHPDAQVREDLRRPRTPARPHHGLQPQVGEALGHQALRRVDEEDRVLGLGVPDRQAGLLAAVLGVVARVGLVRDELRQVRGPVPDVGVDRHP